MNVRECRHICRRLSSAPAVTVTAIATLTLGIGAATALFTVVNAVVLKPLPYPDPGRLVIVWTDDAKRQLHTTFVSHPIYREWGDRAQSFAALGYSTRNSPVTAKADPGAERLDAARTSASAFNVLGVAPLQGRTFTSDEDRRKDPVVVLSQNFAERRFGTPGAAIDRTLQLDGRLVTVIGVMPGTFEFPGPDIQMWLPLGTDRLRVMVVGRLKGDTSPQEADNELEMMATGLAGMYPEIAGDPDSAGFHANVVSLHEHVVGHETATSLWLLLGAVSGLLAIACATIANLLVARASCRQREFAVRAALGASRSQLATLLIAETLVVIGVSAALGTALAIGLVQLLVALAPPSLPRLDTVAVGAPALAFATCAALLCGLGVSAAVVWRMTGRHLADALKEGGRGDSVGSTRRQLQRALVVGELAVAVTLLCGAGLLMRSFMRVERVALGFNPNNVLTFRLVVPDAFVNSERASFYRDAIEAMQRISAVSEVGIISNVFTTSAPNATLAIEGQQDGYSFDGPIADESVSPDLFAALQVPLRAGRLFTEGDIATAPLVAIVNDTLARRLWPDRNLVGKRVRFLDDRFGQEWLTIVGVVGDMRRNGIDQPPLAQVFVPFAQLPSRGADVVIRTRVAPQLVADSASASLREINRDVPVYQASTLTERVDRMLTTRRLQASMLSLFAAAGLALAALGIFGLTRQAVAQRSRELAVRVAVGATRYRVLKLVLGECLLLTGVGLATGLSLSVVLMQGTRTLLYEISPHDPVTFVAAPLILLVVSMAATFEPAWRATRTDPIRVLRSE